MLKDLIKVSEIGGEKVNSINAKDLHKILKSETRFNDWIARRLDEIDAIENVEFYSFLSKTPNGGRPSKEYIVTISLAKEIAMLEKNDIGKQYRRYFIELEKEYRNTQKSLFDEFDGKNIRLVIAGYKSQIAQANNKLKLLKESKGITGNDKYIELLEQENVLLRDTVVVQDTKHQIAFNSKNVLQRELDKMKTMQNEFNSAFSEFGDKIQKEIDKIEKLSKTISPF